MPRLLAGEKEAAIVEGGDTFTMLNSVSPVFSKELLESSLKYLHGFLPINKPKGVDCNRILFTLRNDINFTLEKCGVNHGKFEINYARSLAPFASGIVTFVLGYGNYRKRNFVHADCKYRAVIEFGVKREHNCSDGQIVGRSGIDHLDHFTIESEAQAFVGISEQDRDRYIHNSIIQPDDQMQNIYNLIEIEPRIEKPDKQPQKYPLAPQPRIVECQAVKLLGYEKPLATLEILCQGGFSCREFTNDLAKKLGTEASLVEKTRIQEGPMLLDDLRLLQLHDLHVEHYIRILPIFNKFYGYYMTQYDNRFPDYTGFRPRI